MLTQTLSLRLGAKRPSSGLPPFFATQPSLTGSGVVGQVLTCNPGTVTGSPTPTLAYQFLRDGVPISGATNNTYTLVGADAGKSISCVVTATNTGGSVNATSQLVSVLLAPDFVTTGLQAWWPTYFSQSALNQQTLSGSPVVSRFNDQSGNGRNLVQDVLDFTPAFSSGLVFPAITGNTPGKQLGNITLYQSGLPEKGLGTAGLFNGISQFSVFAQLTPATSSSSIKTLLYISTAASFTNTAIRLRFALGSTSGTGYRFYSQLGDAAPTSTISSASGKFVAGTKYVIEFAVDLSVPQLEVYINGVKDGATIPITAHGAGTLPATDPWAIYVGSDPGGANALCATLHEMLLVHGAVGSTQRTSIMTALNGRAY